MHVLIRSYKSFDNILSINVAVDALCQGNASVAGTENEDADRMFSGTEDFKKEFDGNSGEPHNKCTQKGDKPDGIITWV